MGPSFDEVSIDNESPDAHRMYIEAMVPDNWSMDEDKVQESSAMDNERLMHKCDIRPEGVQLPQDPPDVAGAGFWANMQMLFASQTNDMRGMVGVLDRKLDADQKTSSITTLTASSSSGGRKHTDLTAKFEELTKLIAKVELTATSRGGGGGGEAAAAAQWQPQHVTLGGGWPPRSKKELIVADSKRLLECLPKSTKDNMVKPCAPGAYGSIAKMKAPRQLLDSCAFELQRFLAEWKREGCEGPRWEAVERSTAVGARKRRCEEVADLVNGKTDGMELDTGSGYLYYRTLQAARLDKEGKAWQPGKHRHTVGGETWEKLAAMASSTM